MGRYGKHSPETRDTILLLDKCLFTIPLVWNLLQPKGHTQARSPKGRMKSEAMFCFLNSDDLRGPVQFHPYPKDLKTTNQVRVLMEPYKIKHNDVLSY